MLNTAVNDSSKDILMLLPLERGAWTCKAGRDVNARRENANLPEVMRFSARVSIFALIQNSVQQRNECDKKIKMLFSGPRLTLRACL